MWRINFFKSELKFDESTRIHIPVVSGFCNQNLNPIIIRIQIRHRISIQTDPKTEPESRHEPARIRIRTRIRLRTRALAHKNYYPGGFTMKTWSEHESKLEPESRLENFFKLRMGFFFSKRVRGDSVKVNPAPPNIRNPMISNNYSIGPKRAIRQSRQAPECTWPNVSEYGTMQILWMAGNPTGPNNGNATAPNATPGFGPAGLYQALST